MGRQAPGKYRVTRAVTHLGRYYAVGDVVENDGSLARLFGWEKADGPVSAQAGELADKTKADLLDLAAQREVEVPAKSTKSQIRELLES